MGGGPWWALRDSGGVVRAVVWNAARDMVRDGDLAPSQYLEAVRAHLPGEPDVAVVQNVLAFARGAVADRFLPAEQRDGAWSC